MLLCLLDFKKFYGLSFFVVATFDAGGSYLEYAYCDGTDISSDEFPKLRKILARVVRNVCNIENTWKDYDYRSFYNRDKIEAKWKEQEDNDGA